MGGFNPSSLHDELLACIDERVYCYAKWCLPDGKIPLEIDVPRVIDIGNLCEWSQSSILEGNSDAEEYGLEN